MLKAVADLKDDVVKFTQEIARIQSYTGEEKELVSGFARYGRPKSGKICGRYFKPLIRSTK